MMPVRENHVVVIPVQGGIVKRRRGVILVACGASIMAVVAVAALMVSTEPHFKGW